MDGSRAGDAGRFSSRCRRTESDRAVVAHGSPTCRGRGDVADSDGVAVAELAGVARATGRRLHPASPLVRRWDMEMVIGESRADCDLADGRECAANERRAWTRRWCPGASSFRPRAACRRRTTFPPGCWRRPCWTSPSGAPVARGAISKDNDPDQEPLPVPDRNGSGRKDAARTGWTSTLWDMADQGLPVHAGPVRVLGRRRGTARQTAEG